jgi:hypothetical protein
LSVVSAPTSVFPVFRFGLAVVEIWQFDLAGVVDTATTTGPVCAQLLSCLQP